MKAWASSLASAHSLYLESVTAAIEGENQDTPVMRQWFSCQCVPCPVAFWGLGVGAYRTQVKEPESCNENTSLVPRATPSHAYSSCIHTSLHNILLYNIHQQHSPLIICSKSLGEILIFISNCQLSINAVSTCVWEHFLNCTFL